MPRVLHFVYCLFFFSIVLHAKLATLCGIIIAGFWLFYVITNKPKFTQRLLIASCLIILGLYLTTWFLNFDSRAHAFEVEKRSALLLIIPFFTTGFLDKKKYVTYAWYFIVSVFIAQSISIFHIIVNAQYSLHNGTAVGKVLYLHRPYFGFFILSSSILLYLLHKQSKHKKLLFAILFNFTFTLFIGARAASLFHLLGIIILLFTRFNQFNSHFKKVILVCLVLLVSLGFYTQKARYENFKTTEPRFFIWENALALYQEQNNHFIGYFDEVEVQQKLDAIYLHEFNTKGRFFWVHQEQLHWNTHNQALDFLLAYGYLGLAFFGFFVFALFRVCHQKSSKEGYFFAVCFILFLFIENALARQWGILLLTSLFPLILVLSNTKHKASF